MHPATTRAFLDELEKISGEGYDKMLLAGLSRLSREAPTTIEAGLAGGARMPFIPRRGAKVVGQEVKNVMQGTGVRGALKLRNPETMAQAQKAHAAFGDIDRVLASEAGTVAPGGARATMMDVGRGVQSPQELAQKATSMRNRVVGMAQADIPSPNAPVSRLSRGSAGFPSGASAAPAGKTRFERFIPGRSGVFPTVQRATG